MTENLNLMKEVTDVRGLSAQFLYAVKVNRSNVFIKEAINNNFGLDVASINELRDALSAGANTKDICLSGPSKCKESIDIAGMVGCLISIDSLDELKLICSHTIKEPKEPFRILLRWVGRTNNNSRFGLSEEQLGEALALCVGNKYVSLCGLHFHISGYNIKERAESLDASLDFIRLNKNNIVTPAIVNIGGGLPVCYVDQNVWNNIEQKPPNISYWPNKGAGHLYPGWSPFAKHSALAEIFDYPTATGDQSIADRVRNMGVQLLVEPGRSSLDQAAVSIFRIKGTKEIKPSHYSIVLDGNSLSLSERWFDCEILSGPILLTS